MKTPRRLVGLFLAVAVVLAPACASGDELAPFFESEGTTPAPGDAGPSVFDDAAVQAAIQAAEARDLSEIDGGSDRDAAAAIFAEVAAAGVDTTGLSLTVWPLAADGRTLLVVDLSEGSPLVPEDADTADPAAGDALFAALAEGAAVHAARVDRVAFRAVEEIDGRPTEMVFTMPLAALQDAVRTGADIDDRVIVQISEAGTDG